MSCHLMFTLRAFDCEQEFPNIAEDMTKLREMKTLGVKWLANSNHLTYFESISSNNEFTRRQI